VQPATSAPPISGDFGAPAPESRVFAVAVSDSHLVTHITALAGGEPPTVITAAGVRLPTSIAAFDTATRLLLLNSPAPVAAPPAFADTIPQPGALVVGAARSPSIDVAVPVFITSVSAERYGVGAIAQSAPGLPIYNLDGGLLAVSAGDGTAWRIRFALDRLLAQAATAALPSSIGIAFQPIAEPLAAAMGSPGLAITDVAPGGPADDAGIEIGDVITRIGTTSTAGGADLAAALPAGAPVEVSLRRGRRDLTVSVTPVFAHEMAARAPGPPPVGPRAGVVFDPKALAAASVPPDAVVMMINGRAVTSPAQAARLLRPITDATVALLDHRGQRFFARIDARP
jgi:membrane-associated protease RseP (regulator of RpoE activity)